MIYAFIIVLASFAIGFSLYRRHSGASETAGDALRVGSAVFWIATGIFAIAGGFWLIGALIIIVFSFVGLGAAFSLKKELARQKIAGG